MAYVVIHKIQIVVGIGFFSSHLFTCLLVLCFIHDSGLNMSQKPQTELFIQLKNIFLLNKSIL